jgi:hypothetical protein
LDHGLVSLSLGVVTGGDERGHIQRIAKEFTSALDEGGATPLAGLSGHWCQACEAGDLPTCQSADLRTLDEDRDRSDPAQPRGSAENVKGTRPFRALECEIKERRFQLSELALDLIKSGLGLALEQGQGLCF